MPDIAQHREGEAPAEPHSWTHPDVRHEPNRVNVRAVAVTGIAMAVITLVISGMLLGMFRMLMAREAAIKPPPTALARRERPDIPPEPRLRVSPRAELRRMRASEERLLNTYGWADRKAGKVRIPIERAMDLWLAEQGKQ